MWPASPWRPFPAWLLLLAVSAEEHQYCIIGAGPAGVQLGHFLKHAQRDYVIFERQARPGSFFEHYPRHRRLISLNKRKIRESRSADFAFRHDWNSLIDVREESLRTKPVTLRSKELFPHASVLSEYLQDFAAEQVDHIRYHTEVLKVLPCDSIRGYRFELQLSGGLKCLCKELILATGFFLPRSAAAKVDGSHLLLGYEDVPPTGEAFEGQAVLILGQGNAALETAQELQQYTSELHLLARGRPLPEGGTGVRLAYQTHYVGDIRAGRTTLLDTYLLKSLDTFDFDGLDRDHRLVLVPCAGRICVWSVEASDCIDQRCQESHHKSGQNLSYWLPIGIASTGSELHQQMKDIAQRYPEAFELENSDGDFWEENAQMTSDDLEALGLDPDVFNVSYVELNINSVSMRKDPSLAAEASLLRQRAGGHDNMRYPMDVVIRCFGWTFDAEILDPFFQVNLTHNGKYPKITPSWDVEGVAGMYAAGTISHSLDFRKSAGGFIHGFRYTSRALFRLLEERNFGIPWPQQMWRVTLSCSWPGAETPSCPGSVGTMEPVVDHVLERINSASGPYQMFEFLGDMLLFEPNVSLGELQLRFLEEVPLLHFHERYKDTPRLTWVFRYHENFHGPDVLGPKRVGASRAEDAHKSKFLHPHLAFFPAGSAAPTMRHWLVEDIFTQWRGPDDRQPLLQFLTRVAANVTAT